MKLIIIIWIKIKIIITTIINIIIAMKQWPIVAKLLIDKNDKNNGNVSLCNDNNANNEIIWQ